MNLFANNYRLLITLGVLLLVIFFVLLLILIYSSINRVSDHVSYALEESFKREKAIVKTAKATKVEKVEKKEVTTPKILNINAKRVLKKKRLAPDVGDREFESFSDLTPKEEEVLRRLIARNREQLLSYSQTPPKIFNEEDTYLEEKDFIDRSFIEPLNQRVKPKRVVQASTSKVYAPSTLRKRGRPRKYSL